MGDRHFFSKLVTKDLTAIDSQRRLFEGVLTVEIKDRQGEITIRDELMKVLPIWIARGGPITDTHSNRVVGQGINFASTSVTDGEGNTYPAITIQGEIFKDYELDNEIWEAIKSGKYKGLSFGGATKSNRTPIIEKDGTVAYSLKDLEQYEVAVCEEPAVEMALITQHNALAKAYKSKAQDRGNGMVCIRCDKVRCYVEKNGEAFADVTDANVPTDDKQTEAFKDEKEKSSYGDMKHIQDNPKSEELEADQSTNSMCQDAGATYRGVAGKATLHEDDAEYGGKVRVGVDSSPETPIVKDEKALDEDNKELLEEAGLEEEKKLEYAVDETDGPERKNKIVPAIIAGAAGAAGRAVVGAGKEIAGDVAEQIDPADSCKAISNVGGKTRLQTELNVPGAVNPKKEHMEHGSVADASLSNHEATHFDPEVAEKWKAIKLLNLDMTLKVGGCYNTDEVVREYCDEIDKKKDEITKLGGTKSPQDVKHNQKFGHYPKMRTAYKPASRTQFKEECVNCKRDGTPTDRRRQSEQNSKKPFYQEGYEQALDTINQKIIAAEKALVLHMIDEVGRHWYECNEVEKTNVCGATYTEPARGGFAGREPGITRDDESRSIHDVTQPKHVNQPTDEEGAEGVKKTSADPQLQANNSEDGVNRKMRLDNDPEADAFEKDKSININDPGHGSGGVRTGASYDNAQQDTGIKDNPRKVVEEEYTGMDDNENGGDNENFEKATIIINTLNLGLKK